MKNQITSRDYELISAYLDNQLGLKEGALIEARLKTEPELRKELHEISKTRLLIRTLPKLKAPHNYYVHAAAPQFRPTLRLAPIFGIVSAVASVLLALVIFGSTFYSSTTQVVTAPAVPKSIDTITAQQEVERNLAPAVTTNEASSGVMMGAPLEATPTPNIGAVEIGLAEIATPTTIYLFAYPPSTTTEGQISIFDEQTETVINHCEEYFSSGVYPTALYLYNCPTPTGTSSALLQSFIPTPTITPTASVTPIITTTLTSTITPTPTLTPTPTPSETPSPTASPTLALTEIPPSIQKIAPTRGEESPVDTTPANQNLGAGNPTPAIQEQAQAPSSAPNFSFLRYILLTVEISLAAIAIIAGITAIILRVRTR
jgi:hypothetical protein